jgi:hypothetical protein
MAFEALMEHQKWSQSNQSRFAENVGHGGEVSGRLGPLQSTDLSLQVIVLTLQVLQIVLSKNGRFQFLVKILQWLQIGNVFV